MKQKSNARRLSEERWHSLGEEEVRAELESRPEGLEAQEVAQRLQYYGPNTLPVKAPPTLWAILLHQVRNPLIFILLAAAVASLAIGEAADAIFILIVIALNSGLGAYQEYHAEKSAASLQQLLKITARVRRSRQERDIPAEDVVPGDIVLLESGNKVPADVRLLQTQNLAADESFLTGESMAAVKETGSLPVSTGIGDRKNMVFAGSTITSGRGVGITVGTGAETQVGIIAETVTQSESGKPPLVVRMEKFVKHVSILVLLISAGLALLLRLQGQEITAIFFFVVALAVSAIPEGLPVALTVALSIATKRMSARNVIVRRLTAVESLGSCTVIASDKTGTLTVNQQTARRIVLPDGETFSLSGEGYNGEGQILASGGAGLTATARARLERVITLATLANEAALVREEGRWKHHGDAMDVAFLAIAYKLGLQPADVKRQHPVTGEIPYESERKFSAAFYERDGAKQVAAKGAVETILDFCDRMDQESGTADLDRDGIERQAEAMAQKGLRVLAVAGGAGEALGDDPADLTLSGLVLYGMVGFLDPLRPEAAGSVKKCNQAGIKVIMITGDHPATAGAIARELGLSGSDEPVVTGRELSDAGTPTARRLKSGSWARMCLRAFHRPRNSKSWMS
jgi:magnesium-transporting ATPase (P-type)